MAKASFKPARGRERNFHENKQSKLDHANPRKDAALARNRQQVRRSEELPFAVRSTLTSSERQDRFHAQMSSSKSPTPASSEIVFPGFKIQQTLLVPRLLTTHLSHVMFRCGSCARTGRESVGCSGRSVTSPHCAQRRRRRRASRRSLKKRRYLAF